MLPILYNANETNFGHNGLGVLRDCIKCLVREERNGVFELELEYKADGYLATELKNDRIIRADASKKGKNQRFKIIRVKRTMKNRLSVWAEHVSYLADDLPMLPSVNVAGTALDALTQWKAAIIDPNPFTVYSNIALTATTKWEVDKVASPRKALGGVQGSMLDVWGGEYEFDNYQINLWAQRGKNVASLISYGRNLIDFEQEELIDNTYTSVYPYVVHEDYETKVRTIYTLPEYYVDSEHVNQYARRKVLKIDLSSEYDLDTIPTIESIRSKAQSYILRNNVGVPKVSTKLSFVDLSQTVEYQHLKELEEANLCDTVPFRFEKLGIDTTAKIIATVYDVLNDRYKSLELGETRTTLYRAIVASAMDAIEDVRQESTAVAYYAAGSRNKIFRQATAPEASKVGDIWYQPEENNRVRMYQWDGVTWKLAFDTDNLKDASRLQVGVLDAAIVNLINMNASNVTTGTLSGGAVVFDLDNGTFRIGNDLYYDGTNLTIRGALLVNMINGQDLRIAGSKITLDGNTQVMGTFSVSGAAIFGTIDAQVIRIKNQDLSEFVRGFLQTPTFQAGFGTYQPATFSGSGVAFGANSSYIAIRDTGGRGEITVNGTVAASGGSYFYEMNAGGFYGGSSKGGARAMMQAAGSETWLNDGSGSRVLRLYNGSMYYQGKKIVLNTDNTGIHWE